MCSEVAGDVGVHVAEAVEGAQAEVQQEAAQHGPHPAPTHTNHTRGKVSGNDNIDTVTFLLIQ